MKKLFILLSVSLFVLASCCGTPKNANETETETTTKSSEACCGEAACADKKEGCCGEAACADKKADAPVAKK